MLELQAHGIYTEKSMFIANQICKKTIWKLKKKKLIEVNQR